MSTPRRNDEVGTGEICRVAWTAAPANYDVEANDPTGQKRNCRRLVIATPGTLVITGADGVDVTLPSGITVWDIQAKYLKNTSTAQNVVVVW